MLSNMESDNSLYETARPGDTPRDAAKLLDDLASDRASLVAHLAAPGWLYPLLGLTTAIYVATPFLEANIVRRTVAGLAMAAAFLLVWTYQRRTGIRVSRTGSSARLTLAVLLFATLLLLSVSFGLASFGLDWWIILPALASFVLTVFLGRQFDRQYREHMRREG